MNSVVLIGKLVGKFKLPCSNINAFEIEYDGTEFIIHTSEEIYEHIDLQNMKTVGVDGHLYHFNGKMYVYADTVFFIQ